MKDPVLRDKLEDNTKLRDIIMRWRFKVHALETDVKKGRLSKQKYRLRWSSPADDKDKEINLGLAADFEAYIAEHDKQLIARIKEQMPEKRSASEEVYDKNDALYFRHTGFNKALNQFHQILDGMEQKK